MTPPQTPSLPLRKLPLRALLNLAATECTRTTSESIALHQTVSEWSGVALSGVASSGVALSMALSGVTLSGVALSVWH